MRSRAADASGGSVPRGRRGHARGRRHAFAKSHVPPLLSPRVGGRLQHFGSRGDGAPQVPDFSSLGQSMARGHSPAPLPELQSDLHERIEDAAPLPGVPIGSDAEATTGGPRAVMPTSALDTGRMSGPSGLRRLLTNRASCPESGALESVCYTECCALPETFGTPVTAQGLCARPPLSESLASPPSGHPHLRSVCGMRMS